MKYLTTKEICEKFSVTRQTVNKWVREMGMPHIKIGHTIRFVESAVDAWVIERNK